MQISVQIGIDWKWPTGTELGNVSFTELGTIIIFTGMIKLLELHVYFRLSLIRQIRLENYYPGTWWVVFWFKSVLSWSWGWGSAWELFKTGKSFPMYSFCSAASLSWEQDCVKAAMQAAVLGKEIYPGCK